MSNQKPMMLKDFILYNSPCFNCNSKITIKLYSLKIKDSFTAVSLNCNIFKDYTEIDLNISYNNSLKLKIFHKTNIFETNNIKHLYNYFDKHQMYFSSRCPSCNNNIISNNIKLDINTIRIKPFMIYKEIIILKSNNTSYYISTNYISSNTSIINVNYKELEIPAYSLAKIKQDKEKFINKIKTYLLFS